MQPLERNTGNHTLQSHATCRPSDVLHVWHARLEWEIGDFRQKSLPRASRHRTHEATVRLWCDKFSQGRPCVHAHVVGTHLGARTRRNAQRPSHTYAACRDHPRKRRTSCRSLSRIRRISEWLKRRSSVQRGFCWVCSVGSELLCCWKAASM